MQEDEITIAIIGLSGQFPGASTPEALWSLLAGQREGISRLDDADLQAAGVSPELMSKPLYVRASAKLEQPEYFDAAFFGITPAEAEAMDPQHRIFLECAYAALEDAGLPVGKIAVPVGVYAGAGFGTYLNNNVLQNAEAVERLGELGLILSNEKDYLTTRVSYKLNLTGPSLTVQTACSSSLVAVHLASQALLCGECDIALAGGVSVAFPHGTGYLYQEGGILSPDGHCRPFDAEAAGTVGGNGVGVVVLKRLTDALADGDRIRAVLRGTAINNDGHDKIGFTAPLIDGQEKCIRSALAVSGVTGRDIDYVECHGTGTVLGDPIEIEALNRAFRLRRDEHRCLIGSLKSNIGHLDVAAGVAGLIKLVLALEHETLPASLNYHSPNPKIPFDNGPFVVNESPTPWPRTPERPRRAGLSSFGIGGTNAHAIVEEAPRTAPSGPPGRAIQILPVSAKTDSALQVIVEQLADKLDTVDANPGHFADIAFSLARGRAPFARRRAIAAATASQAAALLRQPCASSRSPEAHEAVFLFPGQGAQAPSCGAELYRTEAAFREAIDACVAAAPGIDLRQVLFAADAATLRQTRNAQPALFALSYALAQQWQSWGITPVAMIGHSLGEYVAATLAGVFSLPDALRLVVARGELMQAQPQGAMLAVALGEDDLVPFLGDELDLAAVNGPRQCVIAGPLAAIDDVAAQLTARDVTVTRLQTSHAFHSAMMAPICEEFRQLCAVIPMQPPIRPFLSNVTGNWITAAEVTTPDYWARHIRNPVRFDAGLQRLRTAHPDALLIEVGPGRTLAGLARHAGGRALTSLPGGVDEARSLAEALAGVWSAGLSVDWPAYYGQQERRTVSLPSYPFERQRHIITPAATPPAAAIGSIAAAGTPQDWFWAPSWQRAPLVRGAIPDAPVAIVTGSHAAARQTAAALVARLQTAGVRTHLVARDPVSGAADYTALAEVLPRDRRPIIVHCASMDRPPTNPVSDQSDVPTGDLIDLLDLIALMGALSARDCQPARLILATDGLFDVTGHERLQPEKAMLLGPCRTLPLEMPDTQVTVLDFDPRTTAPDRIADLIIDEICNTSQDRTIAWRGQHRWCENFVNLKLLPDAPSRLRQNGVYLITGGTGGVGSAIAKRLAKKYNAKIAVTSRYRPDEKKQISALTEAVVMATLDRISAVEGRVPEQGLNDVIARHQSATRHLDILCGMYALRYIDSTLQPNITKRPMPLDKLEVSLAVAPSYRPLFRFLIHLLIEQGFASETTDGIVLIKNFDANDLVIQRRNFLRDYPDYASCLTLLERHTQSYPAILTDPDAGAGMIFTEGSEGVRDNLWNQFPILPWSAFREEMLRKLVLSLQSQVTDRPLRILEIGGGEGHLTWPLINALKGNNVHYTFTDISRSFVLDAQARAAREGISFMHFRQFDISTPPESQGFEIESFDIIVGLNVLHIPPQLSVAVDQLKRLLVPCGIMAMVETTSAPHWFMMTKGTLPSWWLYNDSIRRNQHGPLLVADQWEQVFSGAGMVAFSFPDTVSRIESEDHVLLVACKPANADRAKVEPASESDFLVLQCDLNNPSAISVAVKQVQSHFGRIDGVFHAANDPSGDQLLLAETNDALAAKIQVKAGTTMALNAALKDDPPTFQMYFSSVASFAPARGQALYSAANNFLDAYALAGHAATGQAIVSVNWPIWEGTGLAADLSSLDPDNTFVWVREALTVSPDIAIDAALAALSAAPINPRIVFCPAHPQHIIERTSTLWRRRSHALSKFAKVDQVPSTSGGMPPNGPRETLLHELWMKYLGIASLDIDTDFYEVGGDSLVAVNIMQAAKAHGMHISTKDFMLNKTIRKIAQASNQKAPKA